MQENKLEEGKELLHYLLEKMSYRVNDMISTYSSTREYALIDDISKLPNYKSAMLYMNEVLENADNYAILFIDGDSLSRFNQISYDTGNKAIFQIASVIASSIRKTDKVFRWLSGDEFIVVAQNINRYEVDELAERIRHNVEYHPYDLPLKPTVSIGISIYPEHADSLQSTLKTSELANKKAKSDGKNTYQFYSPTF